MAVAVAVVVAVARVVVAFPLCAYVKRFYNRYRRRCRFSETNVFNRHFSLVIDPTFYLSILSLPLSLSISLSLYFSLTLCATNVRIRLTDSDRAVKSIAPGWRGYYKGFSHPGVTPSHIHKLAFRWWPHDLQASPI